MSGESIAKGRLHAWFPALKLMLVASAFVACHRSAEEKHERTAGPGAEPRDKGATRGRNAASSDGADPIVHVPVGSFRAGSRPTEPGRDPNTEGWLHSVTLGPFRMDRRARSLPAKVSSGAPAAALAGDAPAKAGFSFEEAQVGCAEAGGRLCTEVEWERACKGPRSTIYAGADEPCAQGPCSSGYDLEGLGAALEWTSSTFSASSPFHGQRVLRGSPLGASPSERRCAGRRPDKDLAEQPVTFRCCYGAPNAERLGDPVEGVPFREVDVPLPELRALLERDARTKPLTEGLAYFREDAASIVLSRGPGDTMGFTLTTRGVAWAPARGVELLVLSGRSGEHTAFVVAYFTAGEERILAGTFIMKNEPGPIALAYAPSIRPRLHFSGCWGCPGETGKVLFRPPESIVLLQP